MSDLTLCLITKGRPEYLGSLLDSLERCLKNDRVQVLVILNGVQEKIAIHFEEWSRKYPAKVTLQKHQDNDARLSRFWQSILDVKTKWISFPSDDDVLNHYFLDHWDAFEKSHSDFGAIATQLDLIGPTGSSLGIARKPSFNPELSLAESTAQAFSECPFLWPGLIIQVSNLPKQIPDSRYVLDWWVGIYLVFTTRVQVSREVLVNYRVHEGQESSVASLSRKNLEALMHLGNFVNGKEFADWINIRKSSELVEFLNLLIKYPPIYGDLKFTSELVSLITRRVEHLSKERAVKLTSFFVNALAHDVLITENQLRYLGLNLTDNLVSDDKANFNLKFAKGICPELRMVLAHYHSNSGEYPSIIVGCRHSESGEKFVKFECNALTSKREIEDKFILEAEELLKKSEVFHGAVSPFEYNLIRIFRRIKTSMPVWLNRIIYGRMRG